MPGAGDFAEGQQGADRFVLRQTLGPLPVIADFDARMTQPGGFYRGNSARERDWETESGKAELTIPADLSALGGDPAPDAFTLVTLRSNDQFNTTVYGFSDRLRGLSGDRMIVLISREDMARAGLADGQRIALVSAADDGIPRRVEGLSVVPYDLPRGCIAASFTFAFVPSRGKT